MEYLKADNPNKDMVAYSNIEERLFKEYENLKNTLSGMSLKANQIINKEVTERTPRYEHFTFVKLDSESWVKSIHEILRLIFEVNLQLEIDAKLKTILKWSAGIDQWEEEVKSNLVYSVPEEIYGEDIELCKIPTQTLKKVKELEKKVQILAKTVIDYQNVSISYYAFSDLRLLFSHQAVGMKSSYYFLIKLTNTLKERFLIS